MFILPYRNKEIMFGKTDLEKRIQDLEEKQATLMRVMGEMKKEVELLTKDLEDLNSRISFLNVLSANLNNMKYSIEMKLVENFSRIRDEIKDMLNSYEEYYKQIYADMLALVQQYRSPGPSRALAGAGARTKGARTFSQSLSPSQVRFLRAPGTAVLGLAQTTRVLGGGRGPGGNNRNQAKPLIHSSINY
jgi:hypothetical protein